MSVIVFRLFGAYFLVLARMRRQKVNGERRIRFCWLLCREVYVFICITFGVLFGAQRGELEGGDSERSKDPAKPNAKQGMGMDSIGLRLWPHDWEMMRLGQGGPSRRDPNGTTLHPRPVMLASCRDPIGAARTGAKARRLGGVHGKGPNAMNIGQPRLFAAMPPRWGCCARGGEKWLVATWVAWAGDQQGCQWW
jgi:hypothetical protein